MSRRQRAEDLSKARRCIVLAKNLRAKYGLTVDLTIPCHELVQPELYDGPPWEELVAKLLRYEFVVWKSLVLALRRLERGHAVAGNPTMAPRRR